MDSDTVTFRSAAVKQLVESSLKKLESEGCSKLSTEANEMMTELLRVFATEIFQRARQEADNFREEEGEIVVGVDHIQTILPGILMDF
jgi:histone H3/H4